MASSEPVEEQELESELPFADEIPVLTENMDRSRSIYTGIGIPIITFVGVNITCLGVIYSSLSCCSIFIILMMMCLVPKFSRSYNRRIKVLCFYALLSVFPFGLCVIPLVDPVHAPNSWTQLYLLRLTPPGTPGSEVQALIARKGWTGGKFYDTESYMSLPEKQRPISITLGHSQFLDIPATHYAEWIFDEEGKVITVKATTFAIFL